LGCSFKAAARVIIAKDQPVQKTVEWEQATYTLPPSKSIIFNWIKLNLKLQNGSLFALQFLEQMLAIHC
jgi:hypothetical protein